MRHLAIALCLLCLVPLLSGEALAQSKPLVLIQYHLWYQRGDCPGGDWGQWAWWSTDDDPCATRFDYDWMREISSPGYPLIGPYDSNDPEVMRWHIRLAKAAGVDGLLVSLFYFDEGAEETFEQMLAIANEEGFKIGIEGWTPNEGEEELYKHKVIQQIDDLAINSPNKDAFLRINGKPVYMFNYYGEWMSESEFRDFLDSRQVFWIVEDDMDVGYVMDVNNYLSGSSGSEMHSAIPGGASFFVQALRDRESNGVMAVATAFPGFDERMISNEPGRSYRSTLRNLGQTVSDFLGTSEQEGADALVFLSFNDWNEYSMLEPGYDIDEHMGPPELDHQEMIFDGDPYRYLKILADFKGKEWIEPGINCSIVDDLILEYNPYSISCSEEVCGDGICGAGETCSTCSDDCLDAGEQCCSGESYDPSAQVCCSGTLYTGDCCTFSQCASPLTCSSHYCSESSGDCDGLSALWHLDSDAGDSSGSGYGGTLFGPSPASGRFSGAYSFDGEGDYIQVDDPGPGSPLDLPGNFTVSAWAYFSSLTFTDDWENVHSNFPRVIQKGNDLGGSPGSWALAVDTYSPTGFACDDKNVLAFGSYSGSVQSFLCGSTELLPGRWYHLAAVRSGTSLTLYIDGIQEASGPVPSLDSSDDPLYIGDDIANPDGAMDGIIDEVSVWSRALSPQEILDLRDRGPQFCGTQPSHRADTSGDGCIDSGEILSFIDLWYLDSTEYSMGEMMEAVGLWYHMTGCPP